MKKIEAIIRSSKLAVVKHALIKLGVEEMTIAEVRGMGEEKGSEMRYRGVALRLDFVPKIRVEVIVADDNAEAVVEAIFQGAHTGGIGDGRILVTQLESVTRIQTGEVEDGNTHTSGRRREFRELALSTMAAVPAAAENWVGPRTFSGSDEFAMNYWTKRVES